MDLKQQFEEQAKRVEAFEAERLFREMPLALAALARMDASASDGPGKNYVPTWQEGYAIAHVYKVADPARRSEIRRMCRMVLRDRLYFQPPQYAYYVRVTGTTWPNADFVMIGAEKA